MVELLVREVILLLLLGVLVVVRTLNPEVAVPEVPDVPEVPEVLKGGGGGIGGSGSGMTGG